MKFGGDTGIDADYIAPRCEKCLTIKRDYIKTLNECLDGNMKRFMKKSGKINWKRLTEARLKEGW